MVELLLGVLGPAISALNHHQKTKLMDEYMDIRRLLHEERNKPVMDRDMHRYAHGLVRLRELCRAYSTFVAQQGTPSPSR